MGLLELRRVHIAGPALLVLVSMISACSRQPALPRTADGKPNLQGVWQAVNTAAFDLEGHIARHGVPPGQSVVEGGTIPYQAWALAKKAQNAATAATADPLVNCYLPGVPRIMYMEFPFHIFQTPEHVAITFEWSQVHRLIYTNGRPRRDLGFEFWMGDSRGRWEGDILVVDVANHNDRTWFDKAGNFHSEAMRLVERFNMRDANTIQYEVTVDDPKVFTRPWKMAMPLYRRQDVNRVLEYQCQAELEEANGAFEREPRTWYERPAQTPQPEGSK